MRKTQSIPIKAGALVLMWLALAVSASTDVPAIVNQVSQASYKNYLDNSLYTKSGYDRGTPASGHMYFGAQHDLSRTNIQNAFASFGLVTTLDSFDPGYGPGKGFIYANVVGQLTGTTRPNDIYIVGSHYDSVNNPGADDNASGVAGVIEAARVLSQYRFEATLRFVAFDGEETELYGSGHYASARSASENVRGMVALDMIANKRLGDEVEVIGVNSEAIVTKMLACVGTYGGLTAIFGGQDTNSDHYSFTQKGLPACLLFERDGGSNLHYHQSTDAIDTTNYVDYAYATKITRSAVGYLATEAGLVGPRPNPSDNTWTILVYAHGDHNLSPNLMYDLNEMEQTGSGDGFNIVVQADFNASQTIFGLPAALAGGVTRFLMQQDNNPNNVTTPAVERLPESKNMDAPQTLVDFINWGVQKYPAKRYGLVLWDHGGQYQGFGGDTQDGTLAMPGILTPAQVRQAVTTAMQTSGISKWEFVTFDACLMGAAEVLADMAPLTDVFIACPELDFGDGWDYAASLGYLKGNPGVTALNFGIQEASTWRNHHMKPESKGDLALAAHAVYDLTKYPVFVQKFNAFGEALIQAATPQNTGIPQARLQTTAYAIQDVKDANKPSGYIDVGEFALRLARNNVSSAELKQAAEAMIASLQPMVVAKVMGALKTNAMGLSVYYPVEGSADDSTYLDLNFSKQTGASWPRFLAAVAQNRSQNTTPPILTYEANSNLTVTAQQSASVRFSVGSGQAVYRYSAAVVDHQMSGQSNQVVYLGEVLLSLAPGSGDYQFQWDGTLPAFDNEEASAPVYFGGFYEDEDPSILTGYAEYTPPDDTESQSVVVLAQFDAGGLGHVIEILDAEAFDSNMGAHGIDIQPGGTLIPDYYLEQRSDRDPDKWLGESYLSSTGITVPSTGMAGLILHMKAVPAGTYSLEVEVFDLYDNESDPLVFNVTVNPVASALQIVSLSDGHLKISWPIAASGYILQTTTDLNSRLWSNVSTNGITTDGVNSLLISPMTTGAQFYRLRKASE